jgi:hypothetical protein
MRSAAPGAAMRRCCSVAPAPSTMWACRFCTTGCRQQAIALRSCVSTSTQCTPASTSITSSGASTALRGWWRSCSQTVSVGPRSPRACRRCAGAGPAGTTHGGPRQRARRHRRRRRPQPPAPAGRPTARRAARRRLRRASGHRRGLAGCGRSGCSVQPAPASGWASQPGSSADGRRPATRRRSGRRQVAEGFGLRGRSSPACAAGGGRPGDRRGRCPWPQASSVRRTHEAGAAMSRPGQAAGLGDAALVQPQHGVGRQRFDQLQVVRHHEEGRALRAQALHQLHDGAHAVDVHAGVDLVQHRQPRPQQRELQQFVALALAAGEAVVDRPGQHRLGQAQARRCGTGVAQEVEGVERRSPRASRTAFSAVRMNRLFLTPGISGGAWNDTKSPARARASGLSASRSCPARSA